MKHLLNVAENVLLHVFFCQASSWLVSNVSALRGTNSVFG